MFDLESSWRRRTASAVALAALLLWPQAAQALLNTLWFDYLHAPELADEFELEVAGADDGVSKAMAEENLPRRFVLFGKRRTVVEREDKSVDVRVRLREQLELRVGPGGGGGVVFTWGQKNGNEIVDLSAVVDTIHVVFDAQRTTLAQGHVRMFVRSQGGGLGVVSDTFQNANPEEDDLTVLLKLAALKRVTLPNDNAPQPIVDLRKVEEISLRIYATNPHPGNRHVVLENVVARFDKQAAITFSITRASLWSVPARFALSQGVESPALLGVAAGETTLIVTRIAVIGSLAAAGTQMFSYMYTAGMDPVPIYPASSEPTIDLDLSDAEIDAMLPDILAAVGWVEDETHPSVTVAQVLEADSIRTASDEPSGVGSAALGYLRAQIRAFIQLSQLPAVFWAEGRTERFDELLEVAQSSLDALPVATEAFATALESAIVETDSGYQTIASLLGGPTLTEFDDWLLAPDLPEGEVPMAAFLLQQAGVAFDADLETELTDWILLDDGAHDLERAAFGAGIHTLPDLLRSGYAQVPDLSASLLATVGLTPECGDGVDNDLDGLVDGADDCRSESDSAEQTDCLNLVDEDGDDAVDLLDEGCVSPLDGSELLGDLDFDYDVDETDRDLFFAAYGHGEGASSYLVAADFDLDGIVTLVDYQVWLVAFEEYVASVAATGSSCGATGIEAGLLWLWLIRRRSSHVRRQRCDR